MLQETSTHYIINGKQYSKDEYIKEGDVIKTKQERIDPEYADYYSKHIIKIKDDKISSEQYFKTQSYKGARQKYLIKDISYSKKGRTERAYDPYGYSTRLRSEKQFQNGQLIGQDRWGATSKEDQTAIQVMQQQRADEGRGGTYGLTQTDEAKIKIALGKQQRKETLTPSELSAVRKSQRAGYEGLTKEQYTRSKSFTYQEQQRRYGKVVTDTPQKQQKQLSQFERLQARSLTEEAQQRRFGDVYYKRTPTISFYPGAYTKISPEVEEKFARGIALLKAKQYAKDFTPSEQGKTTIYYKPSKKLDEPSKITYRVGPDRPPKEYKKVEEIKQIIIPKSKIFYEEVKEFVGLPGKERREKTIEFVEKKIDVGVQKLFSISAAGEKIIKARERVLSAEREPGFTYKGLKDIGGTAIYETTRSIAQIPSSILKIESFFIDKTTKQQKKAIKEVKEATILSFKTHPITTSLTLAGTLFASKKLFEIPGKIKSTIKTPGKATLSKEARSILRRAEKQTPGKITGEQYYGVETKDFFQTRKVIKETPEFKETGLEKATLFKTETPKPSIAIARGDKMFSVITPEGTQYTTIKVLKRLRPKEPDFIKIKTEPSGKSKIQIFQTEKRTGDIFKVGEYKEKILPTFKFTEPRTIRTKESITAPDYAKEVKRKVGVSRSVLVRPSPEFPLARLRTQQQDILTTKSIFPGLDVKYGKPMLDVTTGKITPSKAMFEIRRTQFEFVKGPTKRKPTTLELTKEGETFLSRQATSLTTQQQKARTRFEILFEPKLKKAYPQFDFKTKKGKVLQPPELEPEGLIKDTTFFKKPLKKGKKVSTRQPTREDIQRVLGKGEVVLSPEVETIYIQRPGIRPIKTTPTVYDIRKIYDVGKQTPLQFGVTPKSLSKTIQETGQITQQRQLQNQLQKQTQLQRQIQRQTQKQLQIQLQLQKQTQLQRQIQRQTQKQLQIQLQLQKQTQLQRQIQREGIFKIPEPIVTQTKPPIGILLPPELKKPRFQYDLEKLDKKIKPAYSPTLIGIEFLPPEDISKIMAKGITDPFTPRPLPKIPTVKKKKGRKKR